jgi:hypothetical protein
MLPESEWDVRTRGSVLFRWGIRFGRRWRFFDKALNNNREKSTDVYAHRLLSTPPFFRGLVVEGPVHDYLCARGMYVLGGIFSFGGV